MAIETFKFKDSSLIWSAAYDAGFKVLSVTLRQGDINKTFGYGDVSASTFDEFEKASSPGAYYNQVIRRNHLAFGEIPPLDTPPLEETNIFDEEIVSVEAMYRAQAVEESGFSFEDPELYAPEVIDGTVLEVDSPMPQTSSAMFIPEQRIQELVSQAIGYSVDALAVSISDNDSLLRAEQVFKAGKDLYRVLASEIEPVTRAHYETYKAYKESENNILSPIDGATQRLSKAIYKYRVDMERLAAIETQRQLEESRAAAAKEQETSGFAVVPFAPRVDIVLPKTAGTTTKKKLVPVVDDLDKLICAVAEGIIANRDSAEAGGHYPSPACLLANLITLKAAAKAKGEEGDLYPGVHVIDDGSMAKTRSKA